MAIELSTKDVIVVGAPGVLSAWGFDFVRVVATQIANAKICVVDRTDEVEEVPAGSGRPRLFCLSQYPSPSLISLIRTARLRVIAFLDEPVDSVRYMRDTLACTFIEALRAQTAAATVYGALYDNRSAILINRSIGGTTGTVAALMLGHLDVGIDADAMKTLTEKFLLPLEAALSRHVAGYIPPGKSPSISSDETTVIGQVLEPMMSMAIRGAAEPICWPASVFLYGDLPNNRAPPTAELTGPARIIFYGPYFHLPAGRWQVRMILTFSEDVFGTPFSVEVYGSSLVAKALVRPKGEGTYQATFSMVHENPQDALELRICNAEGAIEGRISLSEVRLIPE